jgi:predicted small secreted protein
MIKRIIAAMLALAVGTTLAACNTMAGMGKDIERAGEKIQGAAKK